MPPGEQAANVEPCPKCGCQRVVEGATFVGGTEHQAGAEPTTDCADCGHTIEEPPSCREEVAYGHASGDPTPPRRQHPERDPVKAEAKACKAHVDVIVCDQADLDSVVAGLGGQAALTSMETPTVFTDDEYTDQTVKLNRIGVVDDDYGIVTQLNDPLRSGDAVRDLRREHGGGFADVLLGLKSMGDG